jgi:hypothetical protein
MSAKNPEMTDALKILVIILGGPHLVLNVKPTIGSVV